MRKNSDIACCLPDFCAIRLPKQIPGKLKRKKRKRNARRKPDRQQETDNNHGRPAATQAPAQTSETGRYHRGARPNFQSSEC
jgi:hypothetical protein